MPGVALRRVRRRERCECLDDRRGFVLLANGSGDLVRVGLGQPELVGEPLAARAGLLGRELLAGHPRAGLLEAHGGCGELLDREPHERLVHGADLLDIERLVRQSLVAQIQQAVQHQVDGLVGDRGDRDPTPAVDIVWRRRRWLGHALEEGVDVRREQLAVARGHDELAVRDTEEDRAEQRDQPAVRAVASRHRVGKRARVGGQLVVQAEHGQVLGVQRVLDWQKAIVLGVEDEDQAEHEREQPGVNVLAATIGVGVRAA